MRSRGGRGRGSKRLEEEREGRQEATEQRKSKGRRAKTSKRIPPYDFFPVGGSHLYW